jgi:hypothetical protein
VYNRTGQGAGKKAERVFGICNTAHHVKKDA